MDPPVPDPGPTGNDPVYLAELETYLYRCFICGCCEIAFGTLLFFFASTLASQVAGFVPFIAAILTVACGIHLVSQFRSVAQLTTNTCCCQPLTAIIAHGFLQPVLGLLAATVFGVGAFLLAKECATCAGDPTQTAMIAIGMAGSTCICIDALIISCWNGRLRDLIEVHPIIGDPELVYDHARRGNIILGNGTSRANNNNNSTAMTGLNRLAVLVQTVQLIHQLAEQERAQYGNPLSLSPNNSGGGANSNNGGGGGGHRRRASSFAPDRSVQEEDAFFAHHQAQAMMRAAREAAPVQGIVVSVDDGTPMLIASPTTQTPTASDGSNSDGPATPTAASAAAAAVSAPPPMFGYLGSPDSNNPNNVPIVVVGAFSVAPPGFVVADE